MRENLFNKFVIWSSTCLHRPLVPLTWQTGYSFVLRSLPVSSSVHTYYRGTERRNPSCLDIRPLPLCGSPHCVKVNLNRRACRHPRWTLERGFTVDVFLPVIMGDLNTTGSITRKRRATLSAAKASNLQPLSEIPARLALGDPSPENEPRNRRERTKTKSDTRSQNSDISARLRWVCRVFRNHAPGKLTRFNKLSPSPDVFFATVYDSVGQKMAKTRHPGRFL